MQVSRRVRADAFHGLNAQAPRELLNPEEFQTDLNGDRRKDRSWRNRRGYSRLLDTDGAGLSFAGSSGNVLKRVLPFERDDDTMYVVFSGGLTAFDSGLAEEVVATEPGEAE